MVKRNKSPNEVAVRWGVGLAGFVLAGVFVYAFPFIHIVPLDRAGRESRQFDPKAYAEEFWTQRLPAALDRAVDIKTLFAAIQDDLESAKVNYATTLGIGDVYTYFVSGTGRVGAIDPDSLSLHVTNTEEADVVIKTSRIFGNAIRNGTNLIDVNEFPNSKDFNRISAEINRIVENDVVPPILDELSVGNRIQFVGCAEIVNEESDLTPLCIVPIRLEILSSGVAAK